MGGKETLYVSQTSSWFHITVVGGTGRCCNIASTYSFSLIFLVLDAGKSCLFKIRIVSFFIGGRWTGKGKKNIIELNRPSKLGKKKKAK